MSSEPSESQTAASTATDSAPDEPKDDSHTDDQSAEATRPQPESDQSEPAAETAPAQSAPASSSSPKKILIGSQRDPADRTLAPSKPKAVREAAQSPAINPAAESKPEPASTTDPEVPTAANDPEAAQATPDETEPAPASEAPSAAAPVESPAEPDVSSSESSADIEVPPAALGDDLQKEMDDALADVSIEELMSDQDHEATSVEVEIDGRYKATVTKIHGDDVFYTLRGHHEGVASARQFKTPPKIGSQMDVVVTGFHSDDGLYELHIPGASVSVSDWADLDEGTVVEARVTGANTGGLECLVGNIRGFIPASQIEIYRVDNLSEYINQKLQCVVSEANPRRRNLVLSHRAIAEREREENRQQLLEQLEPGQTREGTVSKLMDFGAFVDIGGIDGLVHISKMSWDRVDHPSEVFQVGQAVKVKVERVDSQTGKIGLSYRDLLEDPWDGVSRKYPESAVVKGVVSRIANFGAFVKLEPGVEGLIHISELAHHRVFAVSNIVKEGDQVEVKVLSVDRDSQRIGLSLKATQAAPVREEKQDEASVSADEPLRDSAVPKHQGPLKGGKDKPSGGEQFGLKW